MAQENGNGRPPSEDRWVEPIPDTFDNVVRATVGVAPSPQPIRNERKQTERKPKE